LALAFRYAYFGFDTTDDAYYAVMIKDPSLYPATLTQFHFLFHPLYAVSKGDIGLLRQINIAVTWALCLWLFRVLFHQAGWQGGWRLWMTAGGFATSSLVLFHAWLVTPNYNTVCAQGLLVTCIGLLYFQENKHPPAFVGSILIGVGGWLTFLGKVSSAAALALIVISYLLATRKLFSRHTLISIVVALALVISTAVLIDGSVQGFFKRLETALSLTQMLDGDYAILNLPNSIIRVPRTAILIMVPLCIASGLGFMLLRQRARRSGPVSAHGFILAISVLLAATALWWLAPKTYAGVGYMLAPSVMACGLWSILHTSGSDIGKRLPLVIVLSLMPMVFVLGTNGSFWPRASYSICFLLAASVALGGSRVAAQVAFPFLGISTQILMLGILYMNWQYPYRQPEKLWQNSEWVAVPGTNLRLAHSSGFADFLRTLIAASQHAGFEPGTAVIDLSGDSPGLLLHIGAKSIGQAWVLGGYEGSVDVASSSLDFVPCEDMARAWIMTAKNGVRSLPDGWLADFGIVIGRDYAEAFSVMPPDQLGGDIKPALRVFYKPVRDPASAVEACRAAKGKRGIADVAVATLLEGVSARRH
jgi:hypothetical protein